ncbi:hypothetical protein IWZ01DRAFT_443244 [Phyllosticta capitalensis]|uniref:Tim44-like domain-containing protein n=2 Tax=Phyllosticta capitalensis TaxID=121624 RepID=A0ABR1YLM0_9PEZI
MRAINRFVLYTTASAGAGFIGWKVYSRNTSFVPIDVSSPSFSSIAKSVDGINPHKNKPAMLDHCERRVPLDRLQTTDLDELTRRFCAGVWSGPGFEIQRRIMQRAFRKLEGRETDLWEKSDLEKSAYKLGERIADHFEVVDRAQDKVVVRCGDSPRKQGPRNSDGIFSIEVAKDGNDAVFTMKSFFFDSTEEGAKAAPPSKAFDWLHREYAKLWMETSVRKLLK